MTLNKSALGRMPPRAPLTTLSSRVNRPAPVGDTPNAEPTNLLDEPAEEAHGRADVTGTGGFVEAYEGTDTKGAADEGDETPKVDPQAGAQASAVPSPEKPPRKPRGPNKAKVTAPADTGVAVDLAALRVEAKELEQKGKQLAAEYDAALKALRQQYDAPLAELRDRYLDVQATLAAAAFSL